MRMGKCLPLLRNENYRMYFSKYTLLNLPKQQTVVGSGTQATPVYWDFERPDEMEYVLEYIKDVLKNRSIMFSIPIKEKE